MNSADQFSSLLAVVESCLSDFLERSENREGPAISTDSPKELAELMELERWTRDGGMDEQALDVFMRRYLSKVTNLHHPRTIAHQVAKPMMPAVMADLVNGVTNNGMATYEMGPPAVALELHVIRWMCDHIGYGSESGGVLTHGGSLANLTALLAARARIAPDAWEAGVPKDLVILAPESSHYSVARAAGILGLGTQAVWKFSCHPDGRIDIAKLDELKALVTSENRRVMAVCANACSTATGYYDDLAAIGAWCNEHNYWLHVDGAHGASAILSETHRSLLAGIHLADSVVWDAHKMLQTSALCAAVLVKDDRVLPAAFAQNASYLGNPGFGAGVDLYDRAVECTKTPLGLKVFLNLAIEGETALAARLDLLYENTKRFAAFLREQEAIEVPFEPQSNILCFRVGPRDLVQAKLRQELIDSGDFYITAATFDGCDWLRLTVMNPLTSMSDIEALVERLNSIVQLAN
ncbi:MAG: L-2,4-diaminobutyrate decarboxylase [Planctomycetota bacterium]|jgi:L-2,4-diaminobutyrate decarboxylase